METKYFGFEVCPGTAGSKALQRAVKRHGLSWTFAYRIGRTPVFLVMGSWEGCCAYLRAEMNQDPEEPEDFGGQMPCGMITPMTLRDAVCCIVIANRR